MNMDSIFGGIIYGIIIGILFSFVNGLSAGIFFGVIAGVLFGVFMEFLLRKIKRPKLKIDQYILYEDRANHFKGIESVGGWLFLTKQELIFQSHSINIQKHKLVIPSNKIITVKPVKTFGLIPNSFKVITDEQKQERFIVNNQKAWVKKINEIKE